ncbi:MAG TPA: ScpA family protein [Rhizomicrobium sp.]|nr:ScpA family protein [Rhizomicrobium sp.]
MSEPMDTSEDFTSAVRTEDRLVVAVDGFEGPLDLLLTLARNQKVDLTRISVLELAEQYLEFVELVRRRNLELAADYLVMAAWLAYLKSRLLLPQSEVAGGEPTANEMASLLRWRLQRLHAMRETATRLMARDRLGREIFIRGMPEPVNVVKLPEHADKLYDLLTAYATQRLKRDGLRNYKPVHAPVLLIEEARERLERLLGGIRSWSGLSRFLPPEWSGGARRRSGMASTLLASLELTRDGKLEMRQLTPYSEIYIRDRAASQSAEGANEQGDAIV